jgi:hypothetical protein
LLFAIGAPWASARTISPRLIPLVAALVVAAAFATPVAAGSSSAEATDIAVTAGGAAAGAAAGPKVVIVVGPAHGSTGKYLASARRLAAQARSYGARVSEIYSPNATWSRVKAAAKGANLLIYLGHGNGTPSPYTNRPESTNGMGLNASASGSHANTKYYGSPYMDQIQLAPNAVVILNRLCYASGNNEWGAGNPTLATATRRVDMYGWSFFRAGAKAVFAEGITDPSYVLKGLFKTNQTIEQIFWSSPDATDRYEREFASKKTPGMEAILDPYAPSRYYRSVIGKLTLKASDWR